MIKKNQINRAAPLLSENCLTQNYANPSKRLISFSTRLLHEWHLPVVTFVPREDEFHAQKWLTERYELL